jgi:hypothetical protein
MEEAKEEKTRKGPGRGAEARTRIEPHVREILQDQGLWRLLEVENKWRILRLFSKKEGKEGRIGQRSARKGKNGPQAKARTSAATSDDIREFSLIVRGRGMITT